MASFDLPSYAMYVKMSSQRHILVEGKYDKIFLKTLIDEMISIDKSNKYILLDNIEIETAENIQYKTRTIGNRAKVELISELLKNETMKFSGLSDREFRGYQFSSKIIDKLKNHKIINNLLWTRGHSIENYFFDINILRSSFRAITKCHKFSTAFDLFEKHFVPLLELISALSISFISNPEFIKITIASIDEGSFIIENDRVLINKDNFLKKLRKKNISAGAGNEYYLDISKNLSVANKSNTKLLRWFMHSHLSIRIIRTFFAKCLYEVHIKNSSSREVKKYIQTNYLKTGEENFVVILAHEWVKDLKYIYPFEIFKNLNIVLN